MRIQNYWRLLSDAKRLRQLAESDRAVARMASDGAVANARLMRAEAYTRAADGLARKAQSAPLAEIQEKSAAFC